MKAIRVHKFGGPDVLRLEELPTLLCGKDEVLLRVHAVGVNPVETYLRGGSNPSLPLPYTPGTDAAGVIEAVGAEVNEWKPSDRVYTSGTRTGTYAEQAVCNREQVHRLPEKLDFAAGAALNIPYATAYRALVHRGGARPGETVLVHGASGGVGIAAVQWARLLGLTVIGTAGTARGRELVLQEGAHFCLDHTSRGYLDELRQLTESRGPDLILEMLSNVNLVEDSEVIAPAGRIVVIGCRGTIEVNPRLWMQREADVRGVMLFNAPASELRETHAALFAGLAAGALRPVIGRTFALPDAAAAHEAVMAPGAYGKIVLLPD